MARRVGRPRNPRSGARVDRRAELVEATFHLIARHGLEGLRTRDIARAVGLNISTLHYHFETKEALVAAVVAHVTTLFQTVHAPLPKNPTALDELKVQFANHVRRRRQNPEIDLVLQECLLLSRRDAQVKRAFEQMLTGWRAYTESVIGRCVAEGSIRAGIDPRGATTVVNSFLVGSMMQSSLGQSPATFEQGAEALLAWLSPR